MNSILVNVLTGIVIAAVSSWITVQLSLRRFRVEKWWERKVSAYEKVIEALYNSFAMTEMDMALFEQTKQIPEDRQRKLHIKALEAHNEIDRMATIGAFLLSDEALARLKQYKKDLEAPDIHKHDYYGYLDNDWDATKACLEDMVDIAKRDLKSN